MGTVLAIFLSEERERMKDVQAIIVENTPIAVGVQSLTFETAEEIPVRSGQFVNIGVGDGAHLLRRPIAVCKAEGKKITICFQIKGEGTRLLAQKPVGSAVSVLLPLGNGFFLEENERKIAVLGGGAGVFPIVSFLREYAGMGREIDAYIGFRNRDAVCCLDDLSRGTSLTVVTDDGSYGEKMNAVQAFVSDMGGTDGKKPDVVIACGPLPMLRALKKETETRGIPCYVSLEERMGCGIGACLVCVCNQTKGGHARVCKDGPVFNAKDVEL